MNFIHLTKDLFSLIYPASCELCARALVTGEVCICAGCWHSLPKTGFHNDIENPLTQSFLGRIEIETATALLYYHKGGKVQSLIHGLKYKGREETGRYLGKRLGQYLSEAPFFQRLDVIVPVPLHAKRMKQRGFNQSTVFGEGVSQALHVPINTLALKRVAATTTQTRKRRFRRWENVESAFELHTPQHLENKNILLVDDVITTGSTIEACVLTLKAVKGIKIWVATIGFTQ